MTTCPFSPSRQSRSCPITERGKERLRGIANPCNRVLIHKAWTQASGLSLLWGNEPGKRVGFLFHFEFRTNNTGIRGAKVVIRIKSAITNFGRLTCPKSRSEHFSGENGCSNLTSFFSIISSPYSFTCANGICENNCKSTIMDSRRSN
jgi:hypothetical protein